MNDSWIEKAKRHDKEAFSKLMEQQLGSMYKVAWAILKNDQDAADAIQDTVLACWEKIDTLKKNEYFKTWLTRILINNCNAIYKERSRWVIGEENIEEAYTECAYETIEWQELLGCLNQKQRIVVELYYVEGFKVREIAQILHITQSGVKGRLQAARRTIETYYKADIPSPPNSTFVVHQ